MKLGIAGLAKSGKTTIFNAITGLDIAVGSYDQKAEPNIAVVQVLDPRVSHLSEIYNPKKTVYATVEFLDFPGMVEKSDTQEFLSTPAMNLLRTTDALVITLRNFTDDFHADSLSNPEQELKDIYIEFILSDLMIVEKRLEKILLGYKRGIKTPAITIEENAIRLAIESLNSEISLRDVGFAEHELRAIKGFGLLSLKPIMVILNSGEKNFGKNVTILENISKIAPVYEFAGQFEMELSKMDEVEAQAFMDDIGVSESAVHRVTKGAYDLLGSISFFTVGEDEVRAWTIRSGDNAVTAAGKIHSDLARGFIRAETFSYNDILEHKSEKIIREKGLFRLEGKTYIVRDGDIINVRFNV
jgi:hypothetical protein